MYIKLGETRVCNVTVSYNNNSDGTNRAQGLCTLRFNRTANGQTAKCEVGFQYTGVDSATVTSSTIPVSVHYCDTISLRSNSNDSVNENTPVTFTCVTQCNPSPTMNLVIGNSTLNSAVAATIQYTHVIQREDHGKSFKCKIPAKSSLDSNAVSLSVTFNARQVFLTTSSTGYIGTGSPVTLTCITDEAYPTATVTWSWSGSGAVPGTVTDTEEAGTCCGSAKRRKSERTVVVNKAYNSKMFFCNLSSLSNSTTLNVKFPPTTATIANLTSVAVVEGSPLRFKCTTDVLNPQSSLTNVVWNIGSSPLNNATVPEFVSASSGYGGYTGSSTVSFTAMRNHDQEAVSCKPVWDGSGISGSLQTVTVTVYYLPQIMLSVNDGGFVDENSVCVLNCSISDGNPSNVALYSFTWFWTSNPGGSEINLQQNRQTLTYNAATYQQSGLYRCKATSVAGATEADARLNVIYAPIGKDVNEGNRKTIYANYNSSAVLDLTVHSFPTGANVTFTWTKGSNPISSQRVILANNETMSTVNISFVSSANYGNYTVVVTNGGSRRSTFYMELKLQGKPTPAVDIGTVSVSYKQITISFRPGMDGGETQTLEVMYKMDESSSGYISAGVIIDPHPGIQRTFTIMGVVEPLTRYEIFIFSDNSFSGAATRSNSHFVATKAKPSVQEKNLSITRNGDQFALRWPAFILEDGDSLYLRQCGGRECLNHNVSGMTERVFHKDNGTEFSLLYYQGLDLVSNLTFAEKEPSPPPVPVGAVVGIVIAVALVAIVATVIVVVLLKRRADKTTKDDPTVKTEFTNVTEENGDNANAALINARVDPSNKKNKQPRSGSNVQGPVEDSGLATYAVVNKPKKTVQSPLNNNGETGAPVEYAQVNRAKKTPKLPPGSGTHDASVEAPGVTVPATFASVDLTKKTRNQPHPQSNNDNFEMKAMNGNSPERAVYGNIGTVDTAKGPTMNENPYSNNQAMYEPYANVEFDSSQTPNATQDESGLVYADISFAGSNTTKDARGKPVILGSEDRVEYATVDFNAKADPLPPSDDEEDPRRSLHDED